MSASPSPTPPKSPKPSKHQDYYVHMLINISLTKRTYPTYYVVQLIMSILVRITRKYQVTIPKEIREKLNLKVGDLLKVELEGDKIVLRPIVKHEERSLERMLNLVKEPLNINAVKLVEEAWNED